MSENASLRALFAKVPDMQGPLWDLTVEGVCPEGNGLTVTLLSACAYGEEELQQVRAAVCRAYGIPGVRIALHQTEPQPEPPGGEAAA